MRTVELAKKNSVESHASTKYVTAARKVLGMSRDFSEEEELLVSRFASNFIFELKC